jgi:hypothetical protein
MARCCGSASCGCKIEAGPRIEIEGVGTANDPFVITADLGIEVADNAVFDLTRSGLGTLDDPWVFSVAFAGTAKLRDFPDVADTNPTNGQVLAWSAANSRWQPANPTTAASGSVSNDASLDGDGSVGNVLRVAHNADRMTETTATGIGLSDEGMNRIVRFFADTAEQAAADPAPDLNALSTLSTDPGRVYYFDGSTWKPIKDAIVPDVSTEFMALSGSYTAGLPLTQIVRQVSGITDATGTLEVLKFADLSGRAGVLSCMVQPTGAIGWAPVVNPGSGGRVLATAYATDGSGVLASQALTAIVTALVY